MTTQPVTTFDKIECLKRELRFREWVYPRRVSQAQMSERQATRELQLMREILADYEALHAKERQAADLFGGAA